MAARVPGCWAASPGRLVGLGCTQRPPRLRGGLRAGRGGGLRPNYRGRAPSSQCERPSRADREARRPGPG